MKDEYLGSIFGSPDEFSVVIEAEILPHPSSSFWFKERRKESDCCGKSDSSFDICWNYWSDYVGPGNVANYLLADESYKSV